MIDLMPNEREEALSIVQMLFSYGFKEAITYQKDDHYSIDLWHWKREHQELLDRLNLSLDSGETKACIFYDSEDWVIKIGFQRAGHTDFCQLEASYYEKACCNNLQNYFATTVSAGFVDGVEVFLQEKVYVDEDRVSDKIYSYVAAQYPKEDWPDEEDREDRIASSVEYCDDDDIVIATLGEVDDMNDLLDFLYEHDINDLHSGNWGMTDDGRMVMIDFSGYSWERSAA